MPAPHPVEPRERVITAYENGEGSYAVTVLPRGSGWGGVGEPICRRPA